MYTIPHISVYAVVLIVGINFVAFLNILNKFNIGQYISK